MAKPTDGCLTQCTQSPYHTFQNSNGALNQNDNGTYIYCANNSAVAINIPFNSIIQGFYRYEDSLYISNKFKPTYIRVGTSGLKLMGNVLNQLYTGQATKTIPVPIATGTLSSLITCKVTDPVNGGHVDVSGNIDITISDNGTNGLLWVITGVAGTLSADYVDPINGETIPISFVPTLGQVSGTFNTINTTIVGPITTYDVSGQISFAVDITNSNVSDIFMVDNNDGLFNEIEYNINNIYQFESDPQGAKSLMEIMKGTNQLNFISCSVLKSAQIYNGTQDQLREIIIQNNTSTPYWVAVVYQDFSWLYR